MANKATHKSQTMRFIVRRAFRHGSVSRADLLTAFDISSASATRFMTDALAQYEKILERKGHSLLPKPLAKCPSYATEVDLLKNLDSGKRDVKNIGLFDHELPITYVSWTHSLPQKSGILQTLISAIGKQKQLDIVYLGLRQNESPRKRKILPLSLEKMNDQWRVIAQDLDTRTFPVKVFVLSRILDASFSLKKVYIPIIKGYKDTNTKLRVSLDPRYTPEQTQMLTHELNIVNGEVIVATRSLHEFKRRFTNTPPSEDAVWPPLLLK
jgi:hypothetical protein